MSMRSRKFGDYLRFVCTGILADSARINGHLVWTPYAPTNTFQIRPNVHESQREIIRGLVDLGVLHPLSGVAPPDGRERRMPGRGRKGAVYEVRKKDQLRLWQETPPVTSENEWRVFVATRQRTLAISHISVGAAIEAIIRSLTCATYPEKLLETVIARIRSGFRRLRPA